jgi:hypothetical protein
MNVEAEKAVKDFVVWFKDWMKQPEVSIFFATYDNNKMIRTYPSLDSLVELYLADHNRAAGER